MNYTTDPVRESEETRRCADCDTETTHLILVWSFGSVTTECRECGWVAWGVAA